MNPNSNPEESLKDSVLGKIHTDHLSMRPRLYFTLMVVATALVAVLALAISIFLCNFVLFGLEASGRAVLLGFGTRGFLAFLQVFPWGLLILEVLLVALLGWLIRQFKFGYRIPTLYIFLGLLVITILLGFVIKIGTNINSVLSQQDEKGMLPLPFTGLYNDARRLPPTGVGFYRSVITEIHGDEVTVMDTEMGTTTILHIKVPMNADQATTSGLRVGDTIFVGGDPDDRAIIHAYGVRKMMPHMMHSELDPLPQD